MTAVPAGSASVEPADAVAAAVLSVPGVAGLHPGTFGEVATYLAGRKVTGVRLRDDSTEVHITVAWPAPVLATADAVRAAAAPLVRTPVDVYVQDVVQPAVPDVVQPTMPRDGP